MIEDAHTRLMKKIHEYYKLNFEWEAKQTHVSGIAIRKLLNEIRAIAHERRKEIQEVRAVKPKVKSPKYRESNLKAQGSKK
jgi:hypothetical protein